jgi:hypothetical protein
MRNITNDIVEKGGKERYKAPGIKGCACNNREKGDTKT